ncbi:hypothetical protein [Litoribacter populi]|uniref:hypothetical protein n=1 Tax=Litoribacter populi TaxID=2598460 RepID=UPI00117D2083|nr:hypothetical protein [Litoribacter populi]
MNVEILGIMGSGKTTLCRSLNYKFYKKLGYFPAPMSSYLQIPYDPVLYLSHFFVKHFIKRNCYRLGKILYNSNVPLKLFKNENESLYNELEKSYINGNNNINKNQFKSEEWDYFLALSGFYQRHKIINKRDWFLIDEGFLKSIKHFLVNGDGSINNEKEFLFDLVPKVDILIHCKVPSKVAYERLEKRPAGIPPYLKFFDESKRLEILDKIDLSNSSMAEFAKKRGVKVIQLNMENNMGQITNELLREIII